MSVSPPKEGVEQGDATPEHSESMERGEEAQVREAYDFEVKEQDRWLPIANGWSRSIPHALSSTELRVFVLRRCMMMEPSLLQFPRAQNRWLPSPQSKDLRQHLVSLISMVNKHLPICLVGTYNVPKFPALHITSPSWFKTSQPCLGC